MSVVTNDNDKSATKSQQCRFFAAKGSCTKPGCKYTHIAATTATPATVSTTVPAAAASVVAAPVAGVTRTAPSAVEVSPAPIATVPPTTTAAPLTQTAAVKVKIIQLDTEIDSEFLAKLQKQTPFEIRNGVVTSRLHGPSRAERTVAVTATDLLVPGGIDFQGKSRGYPASVVGKSICRHKYFADDYSLGASLCDDHDPVLGICPHQMALLDGSQNTIKCVDVPLKVSDVQHLFGTYDKLKALYLINHCYTAPGKYADQSVMWVKNDDAVAQLFGHALYERTGSVGQWYITCPGATPIKEPDQHWLTSGVQPSGLKAEAFLQIGSYIVTKITRNAANEAREPQLIAASDVFNPALTAGSYRLNCDKVVYKYSARFAILSTPDFVQRFDPTEVAILWRRLDGKKNTPDIQSKCAADWGREVHTMSFDEASLVATELKRLNDTELLHVQYQPTTETAWWYIGYFRWLADSRRYVDEKMNALRGSAAAQRHIGRLWFYLALVLVSLSVVPLPVPGLVYEWYMPPSLAWYHIAINVWTGRLSMWFPFVWLIPRAEQKWWYAIDWLDGTSIAWIRQIIFTLALLSFVKSARSEQFSNVCNVREQYITDIFVPMKYCGFLDRGNASFPGYVSEMVLSKLAEGCTVKPGTAIDPSEVDMLFATGIVTGRAPHVARPCLKNELNAIINRQLMVTPQYDGDSFDVMAKAFVNQFPFDRVELRHVGFDEWNARFPLARRSEHLAARRNLLEGAGFMDSEVWVRKLFIKIEKIWKQSHYDVRAISGGTDAWNVQVGPWFYSMGEGLKNAFRYDSPGGVFYATATTSWELGQWFMNATVKGGIAVSGDDQLILLFDNGELILIEGDGKRHDAHMHERFYKLKWLVYKMIMRGDIPYAAKLAELGQCFSNGIGRFGTRYGHLYRVRSGDPDTSFGNSLLTHFVAFLTVHAWHVLRLQGYDILSVRQAVIDVVEYITGYELELHVTFDDTDVTFLQGVFVPVDNTIYWVPKIGRVMANAGWSLNRPINDKKMWTEMAGMVNSYYAYRFMPFFRCWLKTMRKLIPEQYHATLPTDKKTVEATGIASYHPDDSTWGFVMMRYGLTREDEIVFQKELEEVTQVPYMLQSTILDRMVERDL